MTDVLHLGSGRQAMTDREQFEQHFKLTIRQQKRFMQGDYRDELTQARWEGWQAREQLQGEREPDELLKCERRLGHCWTRTHIVGHGPGHICGECGQLRDMDGRAIYTGQ